MPTTINPYQPPQETRPSLESPSDFSKSGCTEFAGQLTLEQYVSAQQIWQPKKVGWTKLVGLSLLPIFVFGSATVEAYLSDEGELFLEQIIAIALCLSVLAAYFVGKSFERRQLRALASNRKGVFTPCKGAFQNRGLRFAAEGLFPIDYSWGDFVGYRASDEILLLYVDYPKQVNFLARNWFSSEEDWLRLKSIVATELPKIPPFAKKAPRSVSEKHKLLNEASQLLAREKWNEATSKFDEVLQIDQQNLIASAGKSLALTAVGQVEKAMPYSDRAIAGGADNKNTRLVHGTLLVMNKRFSEAFPFLDSTLEEFPDNSCIWRDRGLAHLKTGELDKALADTSRSLELNPHDGVAYNNRGAIHIEMGNAEKAIEDLEMAVSLLPEFDRPRQLLENARALPSAT